MKRFILFSLFFILFFIYGCAPRYIIDMSLRIPPEVDIGAKRIAIIPTEENQYSYKLSNMLISKLSEIGYFEILERTRLDAIIREMQLSLSGLMDLEKAVELGRIAGIEALVLISLEDFSIEDINEIEEYSIQSKKREGVVYKIYVPKLTRTGFLSVSFRVISVSTSQIIISRSFSEKFKGVYYQSPHLDHIPQDELSYVKLWLLIREIISGDPKTKGEIFDELSKKVVDSIVKKISPYFEKISAIWEDLKIKEQEVIISLIKTGLIDEAIKEMEKLRYNPNITKDRKLLASYYYNLGLIYELKGNLERAKELYLESVKLDPTQNHNNALKRVIERMKRELK